MADREKCSALDFTVGFRLDIEVDAREHGGQSWITFLVISKCQASDKIPAPLDVDLQQAKNTAPPSHRIPIHARSSWINVALSDLSLPSNYIHSFLNRQSNPTFGLGEGASMSSKPSETPKDDKDALDLLEAEAKEFDKAS